MRKIKIGGVNGVCKTNALTLSRSDKFEDILYLDTSSLTRNCISQMQILRRREAPSRAQRLVKKNTILYSTVRPNLEHFGIIENPADNMVVSTGFTTLDVIDQKVDPKYLYYKLTQKHITQYLHSIAETSVSSYPSINPSDLENLHFDIPDDINSQRQIAAVLSSLDSRIELNNRINDNLEQLAKTLYDYWFVQFEFPDKGGKPYKSSGGKMVYNTELKRGIPEGWEVKTLLDIAIYINGFACQNYRPTNEDYLPVIKIREMRDGITESTEKVKADIPDKLIVNDGDVLFSWSASLEVMIWSGGKGGLNQHIFKVISKKYPRSFYYYQLIWYLQHFKMIAELRKTTMGHITQDHLKQSRIVIPPIEIVKALDEKLYPIQEKQILLYKQNQYLTALRDWLLPMLMNGQVKVSE